MPITFFRFIMWRTASDIKKTHFNSTLWFQSTLLCVLDITCYWKIASRFGHIVDSSVFSADFLFLTAGSGINLITFERLLDIFFCARSSTISRIWMVRLSCNCALTTLHTRRWHWAKLKVTKSRRETPPQTSIKATHLIFHFYETAFSSLWGTQRQKV